MYAVKTLKAVCHVHMFAKEAENKHAGQFARQCRLTCVELRIIMLITYWGFHKGNKQENTQIYFTSINSNIHPVIN